MLSSRSIMVGTAPKCATASRYSSHTGGSDRVVMRVDQMIAHVTVAGQMELAHALRGDGVQIARCVEPMIHALTWMLLMSSKIAQSARSRDLTQKLPLRHLRGAVRQIARDVLEQDLPSQQVLHLGDSGDDAVECLLGIWQRQQIVHVAPFDAGPAQMIGDPGRLDAAGELAHVYEILPVERIGAADRQRHAVHDEREAVANALEIMQRLAARDQVILGDDLEPIDGVRLA